MRASFFAHVRLIILKDPFKLKGFRNSSSAAKKPNFLSLLHFTPAEIISKKCLTKISIYCISGKLYLDLENITTNIIITFNYELNTLTKQIMSADIWRMIPINVDRCR